MDQMKEMLSGGTTLLFVSHSNNDVRTLCKNAVWLDHGRIVQSGLTEDVLPAYEASMQ